MFDLPLEPESGDEPEAEPEPQVEQMSLPGERPALETLPEFAETESETERELRLAPLQPRIVAAVLDLAALTAVAAIAVAMLAALDIELSARLAAPLGLFLLSFSFVYFVVPLSFWSRTPGMGYARLLAYGKDEEPLTIRQAVARWLGWLVAAATLGLAALATLAGVSPADLVSRTRVFLER